jgi:hypothetical protein
VCGSVCIDSQHTEDRSAKYLPPDTSALQAGMSKTSPSHTAHQHAYQHVPDIGYTGLARGVRRVVFWGAYGMITYPQYSSPSQTEAHGPLMGMIFMDDTQSIRSYTSRHAGGVVRARDSHVPDAVGRHGRVRRPPGCWHGQGGPKAGTTQI